MVTRRHRACIVLLSVLALPALAQGAGQTFEQALEDYEQQRFERAWIALAALADAGHAEAARIALLMSAHDRRLYGLGLPLERERRQRWLDSALRPAMAALPSMSR